MLAQAQKYHTEYQIVRTFYRRIEKKKKNLIFNLNINFTYHLILNFYIFFIQSVTHFLQHIL